MSSQGEDICGDGSVFKVIKKEGEGGSATPSTGDKVKCHYTGTLLDGTKFDSSRDRNSPFEFTVGSGVIQGWSDGVATMRVGEVADFTIAPHKAYGAAGSPPTIPENATLKFEIELLSFSDMEDIDEGCIFKKELEKGEGWKKPKDLSKVKFSYEIKSEDGSILESASEPKEFTIDEDMLKSPLEVLVKAMHKNESCKFRVTGRRALAFGQSEDSILEGTATLHDFESPKETWELNEPGEKSLEADLMREAGRTAVASGNYERAIRRYKRAVEFFDSNKDEEKPLLIPLYKNLSLCYLKTDDFVLASEFASKALEIEPKDAKALFRRGSALLKLKDFEEAKKDFSAVLAIDPTNKAAAASLKRVDAELAAHKKKERAMFGKMFK